MKSRPGSPGGEAANTGRASPLATRVVTQPTVIVHEPVYPPPYYYHRPYCYGPRPVVVVGGHYRHCR